ncbi:UbiA-like protein EboC [Robertkochia aurantiaca]|uniref:UbiA-like protein EboC n=1 Tax=Robertkochia aurantiaca TaxID=2873700 RepID=UPI001CCBAA62|nr:UbiA-like protein EboC [Robertkochia sp. 3YJGBD-33]
MEQNRLRAFISLTRPANLPTAMADILAGFTMAGAVDAASFGSRWLSFDLVLLLMSSICLYAGGVVLNDYFDRDTDAIERPERPIPSGTVSPGEAFTLAIILLIAGVLLAFGVNYLAGFLSFLLFVAIWAYDSRTKHSSFWGPLNMGICRGLNLLLGASIFGSLNSWWLAFIPIVYIGAITLISQGEVKGGNKNNIILAGVFYTVVISALLFLVFQSGSFDALPYLLLFSVFIMLPLIKAFKNNTPDNIKRAVKAGVISLIVLDACIAAGLTVWWFGLIILALLPLSLVLSRQFAVT